MTTALTTIKGSAPLPLDQVERMAQHFVKSAFFPDSKGLSQAVVKIMLGNTIGIDPVSSMMGLYVSKQGKLMMTANLMAAICQRSGKFDYKIKRLDAKVCEVEYFDLRSGKREPMPTITTTIEQFAHLLNGPNRENWKNYPANMLFARNISNAAKWHFPGLYGGSPVYLPDELPDSGIRVDGETLEVVKTSQPGQSQQPAFTVEQSLAPVVDTLRSQCEQEGLGISWLNAALNASYVTFDQVSQEDAIRALDLLAGRAEARGLLTAS